MPQPNTYGQYGFAGYGGFPNQGAGAAGSPVSAAPGMPQPGAAGAGSNVGVGQAAGGADAAAAGQGGQGQWPAGDPNSSYSNYWGGMSIACSCSTGFLTSFLSQVITVNSPALASRVRNSRALNHASSNQFHSLHRVRSCYLF